MRHRVKKMRFGIGQDANAAILRKLVSNFFLRGKITTTEKRAKALKQHIDILVGKMKEKTEANKNILLKYIGKPEFVDILFTQIGESAAKATGGHVRIQKLLYRQADGASMARIVWTHPVIIERETKNKVVTEKKVESKPAVKQSKAKAAAKK